MSLSLFDDFGFDAPEPREPTPFEVAKAALTASHRMPEYVSFGRLVKPAYDGPFPQAAYFKGYGHGASIFQVEDRALLLDLTAKEAKRLYRALRSNRDLASNDGGCTLLRLHGVIWYIVGEGGPVPVIRNRRVVRSA